MIDIEYNSIVISQNSRKSDSHRRDVPWHVSTGIKLKQILNPIIISYLCHIMDEKATMPYPERTEDIILLVCEPAAEYGKPIVYQGTTIANALKDYYSFTTNRE
ncbi:MAG: hypothetical protein J6X43_04805, partial [Bacteroidales bacterium]|nr:hypothetical protein [Bacteroidales bacterium]